MTNNVAWRFYRFDYARYLELRPALRAAVTAENFAALADTPDTEAIAAALDEDEISVTEARQAWLQTVCCLGEGLPFDRGFPRFVTALAHQQGAEDAADMLRALLGGQKPPEAWLLPSAGLLGILTPDETRQLTADYALLMQTTRGRLKGRKGRRRRRGGLLGALGGLLRRLFDLGPQDSEMLLLLDRLLKAAVEEEQGLAVVAA